MSVILKSVANSLIAPESVAYQLDPGRRDARVRRPSPMGESPSLHHPHRLDRLHVYARGASDGTEFQDASQKFENWVKGNAGKLAALVCVMIGMFRQRFAKTGTGCSGVALGLLVGIIVGIINASFTATI
jgi:hypothetical protein